jgi:hypothetical protein
MRIPGGNVLFGGQVLRIVTLERSTALETAILFILIRSTAAPSVHVAKGANRDVLPYQEVGGHPAGRTQSAGLTPRPQRYIWLYLLEISTISACLFGRPIGS